MIRKFAVVIAAVGLVAGACGGGSSAGSCASVADEAMDVVQDMINQFDSMTLEEAAALDEEPEWLLDFENRMGELEDQANDLSCSDSEMEQLFMERADKLTADGMFGQMMIDEIKASGFSDL